MRALQRVLQHAMHAHHAAMAQHVARPPVLQQIAHKTITQSSACYTTARSSLFCKTALSALAMHAGRAVTATRTAANVLPKHNLHTSRSAGQSILRFSQPSTSVHALHTPHNSRYTLPGTGPDKVVYSLIGVNVAVFLLWRINPVFASKHFLLVRPTVTAQ